MGNAPGEDTTKGTSQRRGTEEKSNAIMLLIAFIPHGQVEYHAGEKATFCDTEEETRRQETGVVLHDSQKGRYNAPDESKAG